jgi:hypothetical protein
VVVAPAGLGTVSVSLVGKRAPPARMYLVGLHVKVKVMLVGLLCSYINQVHFTHSNPHPSTCTQFAAQPCKPSQSEP